jgi:hypothetical protein
LPAPRRYAGGRETNEVCGLAAVVHVQEVLAICVAQYTGSWGLYGLLNWLPTYFTDVYGVEVGDLGGYTFVPYAGEVLPRPVFRYRRLRIQGDQGRGGLGDRFTVHAYPLLNSKMCYC